MDPVKLFVPDKVLFPVELTGIKVAQQHGFNNISACCSHKRRIASGYRWEYYKG